MCRLLYYLLITTIFLSCNSTTQSKDIVEQGEIIDSLSNIDKTIQNEKEMDTISVDLGYYISALKITKDTIADYNRFKLRNFTYLKSGQTQFKYYILAELRFYNTFKSYLIAADYESEQSCWIANYSSNNNLLSSFEVYYDNAEGAWGTTSIIDETQKTIKIKTYNAYRDPEEKIDSIRVDNKGRFVTITN